MRSALRRLRRSPGFTLIALACLALGAGVTTTIFSVVDGVLLRPLPYADDGGLITLHARNIAKDVRASRVSWADYTSVRSENHTLSGLGLWTTGFLQLTGAEGDVERVDAAQISASLFPVLGLELLFERDRPRAKGALVSKSFGDQRFAGPRQIEDVLAGRIVEARFDAEFALAVSVKPDHARPLYRTVRAGRNSPVTSYGRHRGTRTRTRTGRR